MGVSVCCLHLLPSGCPQASSCQGTPLLAQVESLTTNSNLGIQLPTQCHTLSSLQSRSRGSV